MESISFCRRKFDAIPFCREMQRRYLAVPKINPKSSDAECSAAPKMRFCENTKPHLFCCFRKVPEGSRTARPAALRPGRGGQSSGLSARARESPFRRTTTALSELSFLGSDNCFLYCIFFDDTAKSRGGRLLVWKRPSRLFVCLHRLCGGHAGYMRWQCGGSASFLRRKSVKIL